MTFKSSLIALCATALLAVPALSLATAMEEAQKPWRVSVGWINNTSSVVRNATSSSGFGLGVGYVLPGKSLATGKMGTGSIETDFNQTRGNGNTATSWSVQYMERFMLGEPGASSGGFYAGLGVGFSFNRASGTFVSENATRFAYTVLLGTSFQNGQFFAEARYRGGAGYSGVENSLFGIHVGARF